ncbi:MULTISPECIES: alpha-amylase family glycosyl hydrolase [Nitrosomonas]|uniref:Alpha amylase catalytic subunit n=1 Tax=Nitrosomonas communis TaxID=44574 RepID=A0A0F7KEV4_9PROT|nr:MULTISPECIES: alpha-amylase family glycosyl hydrolase [Nitrosomonas]AKH37991.1 alpha-amylase [Nitrosomonas communis]TYP91600.1 alpha amylase catalytic subunit [Nitrosomonas communis]UVS59877.1 alpha-amylase family glycosyl hydrolase [Nitrosomonas sp. PLL12]
MNAWPKYPLIYEINTWVWLGELTREATRQYTLASVPDSEWDQIASLGFDAVWLMGVWERSPASIAISMRNEGLLADFRLALPDFLPEDNVGSPYCVRRYVVDQHLGGAKGLAIARSKLAERGVRLILDFVPNHVAHDHLWAFEHPEYFIQGTQEDLIRDPHSFVSVNGRVYACGRDPYFPAWEDVLQLNAFNAGLRDVVIATMCDIAEQCDGVRCDMAMLLMNTIFHQTWGDRAGRVPEVDYWLQVTPAVEKKHPQFLFIAEAYWEMEWALQQQGFDYCYDKRLYDRLEHDTAESVYLHLCADLPYQEKLVRFIENHDEPRAAMTFTDQRARVAAVTFATLPGARLFHEGQFEGRRVKLPVFLRRRPDETVDQNFQRFYYTLLETLRSKDFQEGEWELCERIGWPDDDSYLNVVAWCWQKNTDRHLIVVNLSANHSKARVRLPWTDLVGYPWQLSDPLQTRVFDRSGDELQVSGLYVELAPWGYHFFCCERNWSS